MAVTGQEPELQKRILIVDDEPAIREMVAFALRKGEFEPAHAGDAREAQVAGLVDVLQQIQGLDSGMIGDRACSGFCSDTT